MMAFTNNASKARALSGNAPRAIFGPKTRSQMAENGETQAADNQEETQAQTNAQEETKPDVKPEHLTLTVVHQDGSRVPFKVKFTTVFDKLFKAYCTRKSLDVSSVVFMTSGGDRINGSQTPADFDLEDGDVLEVQTHQVGG